MRAEFEHGRAGPRAFASLYCVVRPHTSEMVIWVKCLASTQSHSTVAVKGISDVAGEHREKREAVSSPLSGSTPKLSTSLVGIAFELCTFYSPFLCSQLFQGRVDLFCPSIQPVWASVPPQPG